MSLRSVVPVMRMISHAGYASIAAMQRSSLRPPGRFRSHTSTSGGPAQSALKSCDRGRFLDEHCEVSAFKQLPQNVGNLFFVFDDGDGRMSFHVVNRNFFFLFEM